MCVSTRALESLPVGGLCGEHPQERAYVAVRDADGALIDRVRLHAAAREGGLNESYTRFDDPVPEAPLINLPTAETFLDGRESAREAYTLEVFCNERVELKWDHFYGQLGGAVEGTPFPHKAVASCTLVVEASADAYQASIDDCVSSEADVDAAQLAAVLDQHTLVADGQCAQTPNTAWTLDWLGVAMDSSEEDKFLGGFLDLKARIYVDGRVTRTTSWMSDEAGAQWTDLQLGTELMTETLQRDAPLEVSVDILEHSPLGDKRIAACRKSDFGRDDLGRALLLSDMDCNGDIAEFFMSFAPVEECSVSQSWSCQIARGR